MTILQWVDNNHHWNENKMTWNVNLFTYSSEELQPNSQGYISKKVTHFFLTLQVVSFNENFSIYALLITFTEKKPSVEPMTN